MRGIVVSDDLAVQLDGPVVGLKGSGQDLDQGRFSGAIFADESVDLAGMNVERDTLEGTDAGERLRDAVGSEDGLIVTGVGKLCATIEACRRCSRRSANNRRRWSAHSSKN